ncbi:MBL fold metallo-hydrolase [Planctomycetes bacterium Pan216]
MAAWIGDNNSADREFVFLGTGTSVGVPAIGCKCRVCLSDDPKNKRTRSGAVIHSRAGTVLIDTPPDLRTQLLRERIDLVHAVLFTHQHADHVFGLDDLRIFGKYLEAEVPVFCDPHVEEFIRTTFRYAFDPIVLKYPAGGVPRLAFHRARRPSFQVLDHQVTPIPLRHGRFDVLGFRIDGLAYCTDVNLIPEESWKLLEDLDVLILDALRFEPHPTHFCFDEALAVIDRVRPRRAILTHLSCRLDPEVARTRLPDHVTLSHDGMRVRF